jgi:hypothetical protein
VLVSSTSEGTQELQESQIETLEPEDNHSDAGSLIEASATTEVPAKARRVPRLPSFFSKVEKTVEEPETSQEEVVKARLARAQRTTSKTEVTSATSEAKVQEGKSARTDDRTAATTARPKLFKTRHFVGMMIYLFGAEIILPLEASFSKNSGIEQKLTTVFNFPITTSIILNLATLIVLLVILVKLDLLPTSLTGRTAAAVRAEQREREQRTVIERQPQQTMRQGVKGEHDDLYQAYRSNQRREKKR